MESTTARHGLYKTVVACLVIDVSSHAACRNEKYLAKALGKVCADSLAGLARRWAPNLMHSWAGRETLLTRPGIEEDSCQIASRSSTWSQWS